MIILFNSLLFVSFCYKALVSTEFSLIKSVLNKFFKHIKHIFFLFKKTPLTFKSFCTIFVFFKKKVNGLNKISFKSFIQSVFLIKDLTFNIILLKTFLKNQTYTNSSKIKFNPIKSKLNVFLTANNVNLAPEFIKSFTSKFVVKFKPSSIVRFFESQNLNILFLRKNKIFNKGRYSRNRQLYRTGVYWCIWLSVFLGYGLYFSFYRFTLNFGYQWWLIFSFFFLFVNQKMWKYHFYNLGVIFFEIKKNFNWLSLLVSKFNVFK